MLRAHITLETDTAQQPFWFLVVLQAEDVEGLDPVYFEEFESREEALAYATEHFPEAEIVIPE